MTERFRDRSLRSSDVSGFLELGAFLGNTELFTQFIHEDDPINTSTVFSRLRNKATVGLSVDDETHGAVLQKLFWT
jgi:hypothetical protein